jgi:hypothetical protein
MEFKNIFSDKITEAIQDSKNLITENENIGILDISKDSIIEIIELLDEGDCEAVLEAIMDKLDALDPLEYCDDPEGDDCFDSPMEFTDEFDLEIYEDEDLQEAGRFTNKKKGNRKFGKRKVQLKRDRISRKQELRKKRLEYRVKKRKNTAKKKLYRKTYNKAVSSGKHKKKFHR